MSMFEPAWLALREPFDQRSRGMSAIERLFSPPKSSEPLKILDLATGTGANLRFLAPRIGGGQDWILAERDPGLLGVLTTAMEAWAADVGYGLGKEGDSVTMAGPGFHCRYRPLRIDLAKQIEGAPIQGCALVTASALLDLVSARWVDDVVRRCRAADAHVLFALTYDGRVVFEPVLDQDALVVGLLNRHQRTDKGFGPAMGPSAPQITITKLVRQGYRVIRRSSDWRIDGGEQRIQASLIQGWAEAAMEVAPDLSAEIRSWRLARMDLLGKGKSGITVGHQDVLGLRA